MNREFSLSYLCSHWVLTHAVWMMCLHREGVRLPTNIRFCELVGASGDSSSARGCGKCCPGDGEELFLFLCGAVWHIQGIGVPEGDTNTLSQETLGTKNVKTKKCVGIRTFLKPFTDNCLIPIMQRWFLGIFLLYFVKKQEKPLTSATKIQSYLFQNHHFFYPKVY